MKDQERTLVPVRGRHSEIAQYADAGSREIVVNGRRHVIRRESVSYDEVVRLAFPDMSGSERSCLTVTYRGGPLHATEGLLTNHQRTPVAQGETFVVGHTIAS
ncbi:multiubiquitin domain-containing protein [Sphingomonas sp. SAFR-052]|uniref:multiubiquitin domain-containing protein n=1 Tax=Sphingomonas sp. SAFR-052 TaxID=3436867 RepID=UPI003F7F243D